MQGKHKESRSYGLTDCACKAVVFEACIIECHAFRRHPWNKCTTEDILLKTMLYWRYHASNYSVYVPVKCVGCPKSSQRFRKIFSRCSEDFRTLTNMFWRPLSFWPRGDKNFLTSARTSEIFFQHKKRNFLSPSGHVIFYLLYKHQWNTKPFHFNSFLVWKAQFIM